MFLLLTTLARIFYCDPQEGVSFAVHETEKDREKRTKLFSLMWIYE